MRVRLVGENGAPQLAIVTSWRLDCFDGRVARAVCRPRRSPQTPSFFSRPASDAQKQRELENGLLESLTGAHGQITVIEGRNRTTRGNREQLYLPLSRAGQPQAQKLSQGPAWGHSTQRKGRGGSGAAFFICDSNQRRRQRGVRRHRVAVLRQKERL